MATQQTTKSSKLVEYYKQELRSRLKEGRPIEFASLTQPEVFYYVRYEEGSLTCDCPGSKMNPACKHKKTIWLFLQGTPFEYWGIKGKEREKNARASQKVS